MKFQWESKLLKKISCVDNWRKSDFPFCSRKPWKQWSLSFQYSEPLVAFKSKLQLLSSKKASRKLWGHFYIWGFFLKQSAWIGTKPLFRKVFTSWKKLFSLVEWNWDFILVFFSPDSLEGYFWSQAYDSMPYQTALKTKTPSSQKSCYCLAGQSVATASVASSIGCGGVCQTHRELQCLACVLTSKLVMREKVVWAQTS